MTSLSASWAGGHWKEQAGRSQGPSGNFSHTGSSATQKWFGDEEVVDSRWRNGSSDMGTRSGAAETQKKKILKKKVLQTCFASFIAQSLIGGIDGGKHRDTHTGNVATDTSFL